MNHSICLAALLLLSCASLRSQCSQPTGQSIVPMMTPTGALPVHDEGLSPDIPFVGFSFPIGGHSYTHFVVSSNGEIYLTDGSGVVDPVSYGVTNLAELRGAPGASPRITALSGDLEQEPWQNTWDIRVDDTATGVVKVSWVGVRHYMSTVAYGMSVTMSSSGVVQFDYVAAGFEQLLQFQLVGISAGNGVGTGLEASSDFSGQVNSGALPLLYENGWQSFDLADHSVLFQPNGSGGYVTLVACGLARHAAFGAGCYDIARESFYQHFTDAAVASATLSGNTLALVPTPDGYVASWLAGASSTEFVSPSAAATQLAVGNDGEVTHTLAVPFPAPFAVIDQLTVQGNGIIAFGAGPLEPYTQNYLPRSDAMVSASHGGVYCWHAYNEEEGGDVWIEYVAGKTCVTFLDVENFPLGVVNPSTFQVQFDHATGGIKLVFVHIDSDNSLVWGSWPQDHIIGFTPPGESMDPGSLDFLSQLPVVTESDVRALQLTASPDPISTTVTGTTMTYWIDHALPPISTATSVLGFLSVSTVAGATIGLGGLGASGCEFYVGLPAATVTIQGPTGPQSVALAVPPGVPPNTRLFAQAAVLAPGANSLGLLTSNGIESTISIN